MNPNNLERTTITTSGASGGSGRWMMSQGLQPYPDFEPISFGEPVITAEEARRAQVEELELRSEGLPDELIREVLNERRAQMMGRIARFSRPNTFNMSDVEETLKVRHLNRDERRSLHQPLPDWKESPKGDVCKNACTLEVDDIIGKHLVNA